MLRAATPCLLVASILTWRPLLGFGQEGGVVGGTPRDALSEADREELRAMGVVMDWDSPPSPIKTAKPKYPKAAFKSGLEGSVVVEGVIDVKGRIARTRVLQSVKDLDAAAVACIKKWTFRPAKKAGQAVASVAYFPVTFRITPEGGGKNP